jgi:hypothetical protein
MGYKMRLLIVFAVTLFFVSTMVAAEVIKSGSLQAISDDANVTLRWITEDETYVTRFEVGRRTGTDGEFVAIVSKDPKGPSLYEFVDYSAFRKTTTLYQYQIKVFFSNGAKPITFGPITVSHTVSGVRRTWGSIKAMFR